MAPPRLLLRRDASQLSVSGVGRWGGRAARARLSHRRSVARLSLCRGLRCREAPKPETECCSWGAGGQAEGGRGADGGGRRHALPAEPTPRVPRPPRAPSFRALRKVKCELVTLSLNISTSRPASSDRPPTDCPEARCGVVLDRWDTTTSVRGEGRNNHGKGKDDMQV